MMMMMMMSSAVAWGGAGGTWAPNNFDSTFDLVSGHALHAALRFNVFISVQ